MQQTKKKIHSKKQIRSLHLFTHAKQDKEEKQSLRNEELNEGLIGLLMTGLRVDYLWTEQQILDCQKISVCVILFHVLLLLCTTTWDNK